MVFSVVFTAAIIARLFLLQVVQHGFYVALAENQHLIFEKLQPVRGEIVLRDAATGERFAAATNRQRRLVYATPKRVQNPEETAKKIAPLLDLDEEAVLEGLNRPEDSYEPLKHDVEVEVAEKVLALKLPGISASPETTRYYPFGAFMSHIIGFLGYDGDLRVGQYGVEGFYEKELGGKPGKLKTNDGGARNFLAVGTSAIEEAKDGESLLLTIDRTIQYTACKKLEEAVAKHGARGGQVIIIRPSTGDILALCTMPTYDANAYAKSEEPSIFVDAAIAQEYEPGSVMKTMTLSAAVDRGLITPETTYEDKGSVQIGKYTIRNAENKTYGVKTMNQVLEESINTGAIFAAQQVGADGFRETLEAYGFGEETGVGLQGEGDGNIDSLSKKGEIYSATASFGQGISVTPLQLVMAYAALVNDGVLMKPRLVAEVVKPSGFTETVQPKEVRQVVSEATARTMKAMLVNVVRNGHGKRAAVPGYYVGGKTGTAQIPYGDRAGYHPDEHIGTFVGFAPLADPAFVMLTKIDVPRDVRFAESSAAPLFGELAQFLLNYYQIPPDDEEALKRDGTP